MDMLAGLDLFSGIGGITEALADWVRPVAYCESEPYCQAVLLSRMLRGEIPTAPIWDDVRTLRAEYLPRIDIVYGGFPCQPFSVAGRMRGELDDRNLWPDTARIIREVRPRYVFLENVPALVTSGYFPTILKDLAVSGYDARWGCLSAAAVGAPHRRNRLWIFAVGHAERSRCGWIYGGGARQEPQDGCGRLRASAETTTGRGEQDERRRACNSGQEMADAEGNRRARSRSARQGGQITG